MPRGALVGLLGPNGAGKTTAMLLLATLLAPTGARARVFGHDVVRERGRRPAAARPGVPGDQRRRAPHASRRTCASPPGSPGLGGASSRAAVADGDRAGRARRPRARSPRVELSGGWRRLVDIARATLHRPDLLILDEPTVGLDPEHRELIWTILDRERRERGTTILFSTHYLAEAEPADRVVLLAARAGRGRGRARPRCGPPSARRWPRSRGRARSGWRGRFAAWAPRATMLRTEPRVPGRAWSGPREPVVELAGGAPEVDPLRAPAGEPGGRLLRLDPERRRGGGGGPA